MAKSLSDRMERRQAQESISDFALHLDRQNDKTFLVTWGVVLKNVRGRFDSECRRTSSPPQLTICL
jgi:hypothetical protein